MSPRAAVTTSPAGRPRSSHSTTRSPVRSGWSAASSPGGALARLGVNTFPVGRGKRATMMASLGPWTAEEKAVVQRAMDDVYRVFVGRVANGRNKTVAEIEPLAQGRVWTGAKARQLGLVDEIGGLDAAIAEAHKLAKL